MYCGCCGTIILLLFLRWLCSMREIIISQMRSKSADNGSTRARSRQCPRYYVPRSYANTNTKLRIMTIGISFDKLLRLAPHCYRYRYIGAVVARRRAAISRMSHEVSRGNEVRESTRTRIGNNPRSSHLECRFEINYDGL